MPIFVKESFIYKLIYKVCKSFIIAYKESKFKRIFVDNIILMWKNSFFHRALSAYVNKEPYFEYSLFYRLFMWVFSLFDKLFALLNKLIFALLGGSALWKEVNDLKKLTVRGAFFLAGILFMSVAIGGVLGTLIFGNKSTLNVLMCWGVFGLGAVLVLISVFFEKVRNSGIVRLIKWILD